MPAFSRDQWLTPKPWEEPDFAPAWDGHAHVWTVFCTDAQAQTATLYCRCGCVGEARRVSPERLQAKLEETG